MGVDGGPPARRPPGVSLAVGAVHPLLDAAPPCLGPANTGDGPLRQVDIHVNSHFKTEWLND